MQGLLPFAFSFNLSNHLILLRVMTMADEKPKRKTALRNFVFFAVIVAAVVYAFVTLDA